MCVSETTRKVREDRNHGECFFIIKFPQHFPRIVVNEAKSKRNMKRKAFSLSCKCVCVCGSVFFFVAVLCLLSAKKRKQS